VGIFPVLLLNAFLSATALANLPPVVDAFTASPAAALPGQTLMLTLNAHDPDCAATCTSGCGAYIRPDLLQWSDSTGRPPAAAFLNSNPGPAGSPWSVTADWVAPLAEGSYVVTASVADSGGTLCGGRQTTVATLTITVSTSAPPVIDSFVVSPLSVPVGGTAQLSCVAHDPAGGALTYAFSADAGSLQSGATPGTAQWTAPVSAGVVNLRCSANAAAGPPVTAQASVQVILGSFSGWLPPSVGRATRVGGLLDGRIAVVDGVGGTVSAVSSSGSVSWSAPGFAEPIAVASAGNEIYVLEKKAARIAVLSTSGAPLRTVPCPGQSPAGLAAGPGVGELTVSDGAGARLYVIAADTGALRRTMGEGILAFPAGVTCYQGRTAVADTGLRRVVLFDGSGAVLATLGDDTLFVRPQGVTWDATAGRLVVTDSFASEITVMGEDGSVRGQLAGFGAGAGQISAPVDAQLVGGGLLAVPLAVTGQVALYSLLSSLPPTASNNGPLCIGSTLALSTPTVAGAAYSWTGPNGFASALQNPTIANVTALNSGSYSVTVTVGGSTSPPGTTTVLVTPAPVTPTVAKNGPVCEGGALQLSASVVAGGSYSWSGPTGFRSSVQLPTIFPVTVAAAGIYSVTVSVNGCTSPAGITAVIVNPVAASPAITAPATAAAGQTGLTASVPAHAGSAFNWSLSNGTITSGQGTSQIAFSVGASGTATLSVTETISSGCPSAPGTATVAVAPAAAGTSFHTLTPCRVVDTRNPDGPWGGPPLQPGLERIFDVGASPCGIPAGASAVSVNVTVTGAVGGGSLLVYAGDELQRPGASTISFSAGRTRANNAMVKLAVDGSGTIKVYAGTTGTVDFILDVNGYFQ